MTVKPFIFAPPVKQIEYTGGESRLPTLISLITTGTIPEYVMSSIYSLSEILPVGKEWGFHFSTSRRGHIAGKLESDLSDAERVMRLRLANEDEQAEIKTAGGYRIIIDEKSQDFITIIARDNAGFFYAALTLKQLLQQIDRPTQRIPNLLITDYPDFARRGVMLDISRDKVPNRETLEHLISILSELKINELQLYTEHTFAYKDHEAVWRDASPMTPGDIQWLDELCKDYGIDLVPNQNSFGHFHRWLMHDEYKHLAEDPDGVDWSFMLTTPRPFSLAAAVPEVIPFMDKLYDELLPNFTSQYFNVGGDETADLGKNRSKEYVEELGTGRAYLEFVSKLAGLVEKRGKTMQFWGDIIIDYPILVKELPKNIVALEWGYEADHPFEAHCKVFAESGVPFYVCPGTSSWLSLLGRTDNAMGNIDSAAKHGKANGAIGYLITDWGDYGHHQPTSVSYLGYLYGACRAWDAEAPISREDLVAMLNKFAFRDSDEQMGDLALEFGEVYKIFDGYANRNCSVVVRSLYFPLADLDVKPMPGQKKPITIGDTERAQLEQMISRIDELLSRLDRPKVDYHLTYNRSKTAYDIAARLFRHACKRLLILPLMRDEGRAAEFARAKYELAAELRPLMGEYAAQWLARNKVGGLGDSLTRFARVLAEYEQSDTPRPGGDARATA